MAGLWEKTLDRWLKAGLLDNGTAERIRAHEAERARSAGLRWPVLVALAFGGVTIAAGVLLFVAAHWDELSRSGRFSLVLLMVGAFHVAGALSATRFQALATTLHGVGTVVLGAGIFLAGQIFNLQEHWPGGLMLWAVGAWLAWAVLRDWVQASLAALLTPAWLAGEWTVATEELTGSVFRILTSGLLLLSLTYLTAFAREKTGPTRRALVVIGAISLLPCALSLVFLSEPRSWWWFPKNSLPTGLAVVGWSAAFALPLILAIMLRGKAAWPNVASAVWVFLLGDASSGLEAVQRGTVLSFIPYLWALVGPYLLGGLGSVGLVAWGIQERRRERINLGVAGFALTVLIFYFSTVMDRLGRSISLIGLGILFLLGGWELERLRRRLIARVKEAGP